MSARDVSGSAAEAVSPYGRTEDDSRFWEEAARGRLVFQQCDECRFVRWPAAGVCPECLSRSATWRPFEGTGTLWGHVVYHRAYAPRFAEELPYRVGLVDLDCGVRLLTRLVDLAPDGPKVGMRLSVDYRELGEHGVVPVFVPAEPGAGAEPVAPAGPVVR